MQAGKLGAVAFDAAVDARVLCVFVRVRFGDLKAFTHDFGTSVSLGFVCWCPAIRRVVSNVNTASSACVACFSLSPSQNCAQNLRGYTRQARALSFVDGMC